VSVLALYEAVLNKKTVWEEAQRSMGRRLKPSSIG
jgi:sigma-54 dependent transcriptional regulator of gfr operon